MKILWINDHADFTGGCEQYIHQTVQLLAKHDIESTLLYQVGAPVNPKFTKVFEGSFPFVDIETQIKIIKPDVIYIHRLAELSIMKSLIKISTPTVRFFHDHKLFCLREHKYTAIGHHTCEKKIGMNCYSCLGFINKTDSGITLKSVTQLENEISINKQLDRFVVGSQYMAEHLVLHGFKKEDIYITPLFADERKPSASVIPLETLVSDTSSTSALGQLAKAQVSDTRKNQLLFVGQLIRGKGLDTLIDAMPLIHPDAELIVCGKGKMETSYRQHVERLGLESRIKFIGHQSPDDLANLYRQSSVVVIPARAPETFCLVGLEALIQGTPVVASNVGGMRDWFKPGHNGLEFSANHVDELADAIDRILYNVQTQTRIRKNILNDSYEKFRPASHVSLLTNLFSNMMVAS